MMPCTRIIISRQGSCFARLRRLAPAAKCYKLLKLAGLYDFEGHEMNLTHAGRKLKDGWDTWCGEEICGVEVVSDDTLAAAGAGPGSMYTLKSMRYLLIWCTLSTRAVRQHSKLAMQDILC